MLTAAILSLIIDAGRSSALFTGMEVSTVLTNDSNVSTLTLEPCPRSYRK